MSTVGPAGDAAGDTAAVTPADTPADSPADDENLPGDPSLWDEEWLPEWVNLEDEPATTSDEDDPEPDPADPEVQQQLAADLEAVERLVASLLTESSAAFEASVGGWEPDDAPEPPAPVEPLAEPAAQLAAEPAGQPASASAAEPASDLASVGFSLGIARPVPQRALLPAEPAPSAPVGTSSPAPRDRRFGWFVVPLVLLLAGAVVGALLWAGSVRRPTPAAAVHTGAELGSSSTLPTWSRNPGSSPTGPVPVTATASSTPAPGTTVPPTHRAVRRAATAHTSARPTVTLAPPVTTAPTPTQGSPTCSSAATTDSRPTQTTEATTTAPTTTTTPAETTTPADTTSATDTTSQAETQTATQTATETTGSQPSLLPAASCAP